MGRVAKAPLDQKRTPLLQTLQPSTQLTCAAGLTLAQASIHTRSASQWRGHAIPVDNRTPAVFAIGG